MALLHRFSSVIVDNPAAVAAGKVPPSKWNDDHIVDAPANALLFADPDGSVVGSNKLRFDEDIGSLLVDADVDISGTYFSNSFVDPATKLGVGSVQFGLTNPAAPSSYAGLMSLVAWANYNDAGALSNAVGKIYNIVAGRDVLSVDLATNIVTFTDVINATKLYVSNLAYAQFFTSDQSLEFYPDATKAKARNTGFRRYLIGGGQGVLVSSDAKIAWGSTGFGAPGDVYSQLDVGFSRNTAGVVEINNGTAGQFRDLKCNAITLTNSTYMGVAITIGASSPVLQFGPGSLVFGNPGPGDVLLGYNSSLYAVLLSSGMGHPRGVHVASDGMFGFTSITQAYATTDTGLARAAAGVVEVNNGTLVSSGGAYADLQLRTVEASRLNATYVFLGSDILLSGGSSHVLQIGFSNNTDGTFSGAHLTLNNPAVGNTTWARISGNSLGVIEINNGTPGQFRDLKLRTLLGDAVTLGGTCYLTASSQFLQIGDGSTAQGGGIGVSTIYANFYILRNNGRLGLISAINGGVFSAWLDDDAATGAAHFRLSNGLISWTANQDATAAVDVALARNAAGVVEINNGTAGQYRDLIARNVTTSGGGVLGGYLRTFSSLQVDGHIFVPWQGPVTIAGGVVNFGGMNRTYDTEGGAVTDDLDTINNGGDGYFMILHAANDAHTIVVKHNTGNILLNGGVDFVLDNAADMLMLMYKGALSKWVQIASSNNGA